MIVISSSFVLSPAPGISLNNPVVGWHNLVTASNVTAETEETDYPIVNVANPITAPRVRWQAGDTTAQAIEVQVNSVEPIDYVGIARHNLGSAAISVTIEGSDDDGETWDELVQEVLLPDDGPAMFRFTPVALTNVRISLGSGDAAAQIAVIYVGALLVLQRKIYVGHTPIPYGRTARIADGRSEGGDFLGRIVLSEEVATAFDIKNMTPAWYRSSMDPFIRASKEVPFFIAWRPQDYPRECGFAWMTNDPQPKNDRRSGLMAMQLQMTGISG